MPMRGEAVAVPLEVATGEVAVLTRDVVDDVARVHPLGQRTFEDHLRGGADEVPGLALAEDVEHLRRAHAAREAVHRARRARVRVGVDEDLAGQRVALWPRRARARCRAGRPGSSSRCRSARRTRACASRCSPPGPSAPARRGRAAARACRGSRCAARRAARESNCTVTSTLTITTSPGRTVSCSEWFARIFSIAFMPIGVRLASRDHCGAEERRQVGDVADVVQLVALARYSSFGLVVRRARGRPCP